MRVWIRRCAGVYCFFFQAEDGIRDYKVTGVQTCALPIYPVGVRRTAESERDALDRTLLIAQLAQARVDFRFPPGCAGVEVHVRVDALELDALVVEVPAVRRGDDHRIGKRAAHGPGRLELAAGAGRQQTQGLGGDRA